jgi:ABC-2 type transport system ATP-binding protein
MIETRKLCKSFEGFQALRDLDLTVPRGAVYGLVGPNGAGKSTLIRHLAGILIPDSGTVTIDGQPVFENPAVKARVAYIPDDIFYYTQATVADMMKLYRSIYPHFDMERFEKLGETFELEEDRPMRKLSKGMQKQAAFRLAVSCCPDVVLLDEPVDGLDPVMRRNVWSILLADVAERGTTVLVSSHNLRELEDVCDHVGIMEQGHMLLERSLDELQSSIVKIQIVLPEEAQLPEGLNILGRSSTGRLEQLIIRGKAEEVEQRIAAACPVYCESVPLTLEEIFIYELGGTGYEVRNIILS